MDRSIMYPPKIPELQNVIFSIQDGSIHFMTFQYENNNELKLKHEVEQPNILILVICKHISVCFVQV